MPDKVSVNILYIKISGKARFSGAKEKLKRCDVPVWNVADWNGTNRTVTEADMNNDYFLCKSMLLIGGVIAMLSLCSCAGKQDTADQKPALVTFVPIKHQAYSTMILKGHRDGMTYDCTVGFDKNNTIHPELKIAFDEGDSYSDSFTYDCTEEQVGRMQVIYETMTMLEKGDERLKSMSKPELEEYHDALSMALVYTILSYNMGDGPDVEYHLKETYNQAVNLRK